jgi:Holliday junction resolvase
MNTARKGATAERKARHLLEASGFVVVRSAASKGVADLVAWNTLGFLLVSVKSGTARPSALEREALAAVPAPANTSKEFWRFPDRCGTPLIERL